MPILLLGRYKKSYADTTINGYRYGDVFVETTTRGAGIACSGYANCYIGCSCNTSNGWYSSCQGTYCISVTDTRYTGVNSLSASGAVNAGALGKSGLSTQSVKGSVQVASLNGISTMSESATTCYKKKTCEEGGYYSSVPTDKKCSSKSYNGYTCYTSCSYKTCSDYGYEASIPSGQTCSTVTPRSDLTCYKDCKDNYYDPVKVRINARLQTNEGSTVGLNYQVWGLNGIIYVSCDLDKYPDCWAEAEVSPGTYNIDVRVTGARIEVNKGAPAWKAISADCENITLVIDGTSGSMQRGIVCTHMGVGGGRG